MAERVGWIALEIQTQGSLLGLSALLIAFLAHWKSCCLATACERCLLLCTGEVGPRMMSLPALRWLSFQAGLASGLMQSCEKPSVSYAQPPRNRHRQQLNLPTNAAWGQRTLVSSSHQLREEEAQLLLPTPANQADAICSMHGGQVCLSSGCLFDVL